MSNPSNDSSARNSDRDNDPDPHLIEDGASPAPLLIPSIVIPITAAPLDSTPFRNDTITDATLDAKFLEHRTKMSISMKESILATRHALERLIQGLPESAIKPRASITIQLDQLAAQLARVDQTLEHDTTSQNTTQDVMVHIHETLQMTVAPLLALKDNLEHLHQKIDSLENTIDERLPSGTHITMDERLPSGTHILGAAGHTNDRTGMANAGNTDDASYIMLGDSGSWLSNHLSC